MNERIKKLAFESKLRAAILLHHYGNIDALTDSEQESLKQMEKFAKLIVRECAEQIKLKGTDWIDWMPSQLGIRPEYVAMAQHIKQHFGVKE